MTAFSTVLFVDGNPVGYKVSSEINGHLVLNPAENPEREIFPPVLHARNIEGKWQVEGTMNADLIEQVREDMLIKMEFSKNLFTAAP